MIAHRRFVAAPADHRARGAARRRPARSAANPDVGDQLRKLSDLHRDGVLTDEEFEAKKAELLTRRLGFSSDNAGYRQAPCIGYG